MFLVKIFSISLLKYPTFKCFKGEEPVLQKQKRFQRIKQRNKNNKFNVVSKLPKASLDEKACT